MHDSTYRYAKAPIVGYAEPIDFSEIAWWVFIVRATIRLKVGKIIEN
jgi:hypothetical protein